MRHFISRITVVVLVSLSLDNVYASSSPEIIPHRGGRAENPENTLQAFQACLALGVKTLELDVQISSDNVAVVYHPSNLSINTNGKGAINQYTAEQLKQFDAAYTFNPKEGYPLRGKGYTIPTFEEVLSSLANVKLIVDLKSLPVNPLIDAITQICEKHNAWDSVLFYSTSDDHLNYLKDKYPYAQMFESRADTFEELLSTQGSGKFLPGNKPTRLGLELVRDVVIEEKLALGVARYEVKLPCWNEINIARLRQKLPYAWVVFFGINTVEDYEKAKKLGANAVYTDNPKLLAGHQ